MFSRRSKIHDVIALAVYTISLSLVILSTFACTQSLTPTTTPESDPPATVHLGNPGTMTPSATPSVARDYLTATIEPCSVKLVDGLEPCNPLANGFFKPPFHAEGHGDSPAGSVNTTPMIADPLAYALHGGEHKSQSPHILARGVFIPGTMRCVDFVRRKADYIKPDESPVETLSCFADFAVSEYVYGTGPPKITLIAAGGGFRHYGNAENLAALERGYYTVNTAGFERVFALHPLDWNLKIEAWSISERWDVYKDECGKPVVADLGLLEFAERFAPEMTIEERGRFVWNPEDFKQNVKRVMGDFTALSKGRIWHDPSAIGLSANSIDELPTLMIDIYDLHAHFRDELGAYDGPDATPIVPPPAPGERHSYPRPPTHRPATVEVYGSSTLDEPSQTTRQEPTSAEPESVSPCLPVSWTRHHTPDGVPALQGSDRPSPYILVSNFIPGSVSVYWHEQGIELQIEGWNFQPDEIVALTAITATDDELIADAVANGQGHFAIATTLDAERYTSGSIYSVFADGAKGSRATQALVIKHPTTKSQPIPQSQKSAVQTIR